MINADRRQWLKGKYVSILGDSISTYEGISNGSAVNTTIESYNAWYNGDWVRYEGEYVMPATFTEAYIITLEKAMELYPQAQIFVFTLLPSHYNTYWDGLDAYNARIRELAAYYEGVVLVDIAAESGITPENYMRYTFDGTHPNSLGMDAIARVLERAMLNNISLDEHEVETVG